jgi:hypothetical protein
MSEVRKFVIKSYLEWGIPWIVIFGAYFGLGIEWGIVSVVLLPYMVVGCVLGALLIRTSLKIRTALKLLEDLSASLIEEDEE